MNDLTSDGPGDIACNHISPRTAEGKGKLDDDGPLVANFDDDRNHWYHHYGPTRDYWEC
jgi:cyclomaltodextrin glucanotransferase